MSENAYEPPRMNSTFTIRDLFWLVLVVACLLGWSIHAWKIFNEGLRDEMKWYLTAATMANFIEEEGFGEVLFNRESVEIRGRVLQRPDR